MGEFLAALLVFGGFWFWTICAATFFLIMVFSENEKNFFAFITLGVFIVLMEWSDAVSIFGTIASDPWFIVKWTLVYFAIGSAWSILKWFSFVRNKAESFGEYKLKYIEQINKNGKDRDGDEWVDIPVAANTSIPKSSMDDFEEFLNRKGYKAYSEGMIPAASENKDRITTWIVWWPTSALWTLINDPIRKLAEKLYASLQGVYSKISQQAFKKFEA